jgi:hypothetical protein
MMTPTSLHVTGRPEDGTRRQDLLRGSPSGHGRPQCIHWAWSLTRQTTEGVQ